MQRQHLLVAGRCSGEVPGRPSDQPQIVERDRLAEPVAQTAVQLNRLLMAGHRAPGSLWRCSRVCHAGG